MTAPQLAHYQTALEARQAELETLLRDRDVIAVHVSADMLDQIQHAQERDMAMGNLERASARLREVRGALHRIQTNSFGICAECEEEISMKRLAAVPWTTSCLACREVMDHSSMATGSIIEEAVLNAA